MSLIKFPSSLPLGACASDVIKVTFETTNAFSNVDYAKAFVWNKTNLKSTGVKTLLGNEPKLINFLPKLRKLCRINTGNVVNQRVEFEFIGELERG